MIKKIFAHDNNNMIVKQINSVLHKINFEHMCYKLLFCFAAEACFLLGALCNYQHISFSAIMLESIILQAALTTTFIWHNLHRVMHHNIIKAISVVLLLLPALIMMQSHRESILQSIFLIISLWGLYATYQRRKLFSSHTPVILVTDTKINSFIMNHLQQHYRIVLLVDFSRSNHFQEIATVHTRERAQSLLSRRNLLSLSIFPRKIICVYNTYSDVVMNCAFRLSHQFSLPLYRTIDAYEQAQYQERQAIVQPINLHNIDAPYHMDPQTQFLLSALFKDYEIWIEMRYDSICFALIDIIQTLPIKKLVLFVTNPDDLIHIEHKIGLRENITICQHSCLHLLQKEQHPDVLFFNVPLDVESSLNIAEHNLDNCFHRNIMHTWDIMQHLHGIHHTFLFSTQFMEDSILSLSHKVCELIAQNHSYLSYKTHARVVSIRLPLHLSHPNGRLYKCTHGVQHGRNSDFAPYRSCHTNDIVRLIVDIISSELKSNIEAGDCLVLSPPYKAYDHHMLSAITGMTIPDTTSHQTRQKTSVSQHLYRHEELCSSPIAGVLLCRLHIAAMHPFDVLSSWGHLSYDQKVSALQNVISFYIRN